MADNTNKPVILVTGANSGMGKATSIALAKEGAKVVMLCRNQEKGRSAQKEITSLSGNNEVDLYLCDLASLKDIRRFAEKFKQDYPRLDVLVNNAAIVTHKRQETKDGFEKQFGVNHLAPFLLTNLLLDRLKESVPARIVNVSSNIHKSGKINFEDLQSRKSYRIFKVYGQSKLAYTLFTYELAQRLKGTGITVNCLHPGAVSTNIGIDRDSGFGKSVVCLLKPFFKTPREGADTTIFLASSPEVEGVTGAYFVNRKPVKSVMDTNNKQLAKKIWKISEGMVGL